MIRARANGLVDIIAGARPNFMKIAPIIRAMQNGRGRGQRLRHRLVHTGQHYDRLMSGAFFTQLDIPEPEVNLEAGSGSQAEQTAAIMVGYERLLQKHPADLCLVVGDVTSTMACSITARKMGLVVAHVEGGIRSGDWTMPEEINRIVTDSITSLFFTTSRTANDNLRSAGVAEERIHFVGNTMIDTLLANLHRLEPPTFWDELALQPREYFLLTLHRPSNVDDPGRLREMLTAIAGGCRGRTVVFPVHPRTEHTARALNLNGATANLQLEPPQAYLEFNYLLKHAKAVITDSGGVTEEATVLGTPCMTLRDTTERPETVTIGTNEIVGTDPRALPNYLDRLFDGQWKTGAIPEKWDGHAGERIVAVLEQVLRCD